MEFISLFINLSWPCDKENIWQVTQHHFQVCGRLELSGEFKVHWK